MMKLIHFIFFFLTFFYATQAAFAQNPPTGIQDEGGTISRPAYVLDCVGSGISCSHSGITGTITVNSGGAETNDLESIATSAGDGEIFIGTGSNTGAYVTGLAACAADEKIEYVPGSPDTLTCEAITITESDISDLAHTTDTNTNANTECTGTTTYYDGEGNCDDISSVYEGKLTNSAGLATALSDETGTGLAVFATSPTLTTPILGVASSTSVVGSVTLAGNPSLAANACTPAANGILCEGTTDDAFEGLLAFPAASSDKTITFQNATGTVYQTAGTDVSVADGGTGRSTGTTAYSLIATGTTATGAQQTLANGATTQVLVGGGTSALPVWTTATGTGSPVRGTSPTITSPTISTSISLPAGAIDSTGEISSDMILESHLKVVDAPADEECLTYESTTGDFEWQTCGAGGETDPTLTDDASVTVGDGTSGDTTITFNGDAGVDGTLYWDVSVDFFNMDANGLLIDATTGANSALHLQTGDTSAYSIIDMQGPGGDKTEGMALTWRADEDAIWFDSRENVGITATDPAFRFRTQTNGSAVSPLTMLQNGSVGVLDTTPDYSLDVGGSVGADGTLSLLEQAAANADVAGYGQLWVKTATPNQLWFTDDAGTDVQLGVGEAISADIKARSFGTTIDGGGSAITTGQKGYITVPFACTISEATVLLDQSGSIVIDVWKISYDNFPPVDADSITASAPPTVSSATKSQDSTLTGWTTSVSAGDIIGFNVDSITTATRATLTIQCDIA